MMQFVPKPLVRKLLYQEFLKTAFWRDLSQRCINRDGHRCTKCRRKERLQAHHTVYRSNWFDTILEDLITLCVFCHANLHGKNANPIWTGPRDRFGDVIIRQPCKKKKAKTPPRRKKRFHRKQRAKQQPDRFFHGSALWKGAT